MKSSGKISMKLSSGQIRTLQNPRGNTGNKGVTWIKDFILRSVYFVVDGIIAFRSVLPELHNPMSHKYYILLYSTVFTNLIVNPRSPKFELNRSDLNLSHRSETNRSRNRNQTQN